MAYKALAPALIMIAVASPVFAAGERPDRMTPEPAGSADTRYCMRLEAIVGSRLEPIKCWTRDEWAEQGVDVDHDWAENGVRTIG